MHRIAVLSLHTSPLTQPGTGDSGGMNVYVRELVASLAQAGSECQVYVRRWRADLPDEVAVEPGFRVVHIDAGPPELPKEQLPDIVDDFTDGVLAHLADHPVDAVHANYWLSGVAGHRIKHELGLPLVVTFHTLARVKAETGDPEPQRRIDAETAVIGCSDAICASCDAEADQLRRLYDAAPERIEVVPPGVLHAFFSPGDKAGARVAVGLGAQPVLLFVGRVQPLKGLDVAIRTLATIARTDAILVAVGGPSGRAGNVEFARCRDLVEHLGVGDRVRFVPPQAHHVLSTWYRAADVVLVPSRSESFGLVALEAAACAIPVVAAAVGGLATIVQDGVTGFLVDGRDAAGYAAAVDAVLGGADHGAAMGDRAAAHAANYTWSLTAARLRRVYADLRDRSLVEC